MTRFRAGPLAAMLPALVLIAACSSEPSPVMTQNGRMDARLAPEIASGQVAVQPLASGTQIAIPDDMLFAPGRTQLDDKGRMVLTHVIQAMIEPTLLTIGVADASDTFQGLRAQAVADYFRGHSLGPQLVPATAPQVVSVGAAGTSLPGSVITLTVVSG
jgi:flagellar motor protein MotB